MERSFNVEVRKVFTFTDDDLMNIVITALEGGIGYWACLDNTRSEWDGQPEEASTSEWAWKILNEGGTLIFEDAEDDTTAWGFTLSTLFSGIAKTIQESDWDGDMQGMDANVADLIFQYGIFGEVVYG